MKQLIELEKLKEIDLNNLKKFFGKINLIQFYFDEKNKREKEKLIPDVLLQASVFPQGTSMIKIIDYLGKANYGLLSKEFEMALNEIEKGSSIEEALNNLSKRNNSSIISRAMNLLIQGHESGADMGKVFKETAEDILETQSILRERNSNTIIQKFTLLLAGGIIVPLVLGLLVKLVSGMNFSGIEEIGFGASLADRSLLLSTALLANQLYIAEFAILASIFVALQEGNPKKSILYALLLLPLSLIVYNFAKIF